MLQNWGRLLFMHWPVDVASIRAHVPDSLEIDRFDGVAWVGVVPFTMWGIRHPALPALPGLSRFHELNLRTYVLYDGYPGVWFFSLDAQSALAVWAGRRFYGLPYYRARMSLNVSDGAIDYRSERLGGSTPAAIFDACWSPRSSLPQASPDSLEYFLTERYCLYVQRGRGLFQGRIFHESWSLSSAELHRYRSTMTEPLGFSLPQEPPLVHYANRLLAKIWPLSRVG